MEIIAVSFEIHMEHTHRCVLRSKIKGLLMLEHVVWIVTYSLPVIISLSYQDDIVS
jgi:hypothetical protein